VLIVEDEPSIRRLIAVFLRALGFETLTAPDAASARRILESASPDVVLSDVRLPGGDDGVSLAAEIRADPEHASTPVVLMSAYPEPREHLADEFLPKPFEPDSLEAVVRRCLPARESGRPRQGPLNATL
jgi:CheY-like chemotaxis protein